MQVWVAFSLVLSPYPLILVTCFIKPIFDPIFKAHIFAVSPIAKLPAYKCESPCQ